MNVTISIGRSVGESQLSQSDWDCFTDYVRDLAQGIIFHSQDAQEVQVGYVTGFWNGIEEESFTLTVSGVDPGQVIYTSQSGEVDDQTLRAYFEARLARLARFYGQEAVACSWYEVGLVEASA